MRQLFAIAGRMYRRILPVRSEPYKAYVRSWPCIACGTQTRYRDAAHVGPHGISQKASDLDTVPACRVCHRELHKLGPVKFQLLQRSGLFGSDSDVAALLLGEAWAVARTGEGGMKEELQAEKIDRLVTALRRAAETLRKYEHCRHGCRDCFCTREAREGVRTLELTGEIR